MKNFQNEIFAGITRISEPFKGVLLDAYGVFWGGNDCGILPGAKECMEKLVSSGKIVGVLSNSTQLVSKEVNKFLRHGLVQGKHFHFLITSGEVARHIFFNENLPFEIHKNKFWLFGGVHPKYGSHEAIFQDTCYSEASHIDEADFAYISIPHINGEDQINPELFRKELEKLKLKNLPMICPNPDKFAHEGNPARAVVRQGSIALMYEEMGGQVFYIGKPHKKAYEIAMKDFQKFGSICHSEVLMVGDTPETDIRGARLYGMPSALITKTGIMADRVAHNGLEAALKALDSNDSPNYFIERLIDDL
ncbi:MAG: TIGR01459 family HAD-type hydrolase [Parachlamydiaceae bacterium]|nr:TIGR01459 family HAD-type hydrolase [Parachlamydiaceae bacterium]